jgi:DNA-damage-inducible protein J
VRGGIPGCGIYVDSVDFDSCGYTVIDWGGCVLEWKNLISDIKYDTIALQTNADMIGGVTMANGLLQLRIDDTLRKEASDIYAQLGLDLPTAIRMFLTRSVQVRGIPFSMILPEEDYKATAAITAMKRMSHDAEKAGVTDMTLEEINAEIAAVRSGNKE